MSENIAPLIVFFLVFVISFSVIELFFIFILNRLEKKYWVFVVDVLMRSKLHHKRAVGVIASIGILVVISLVLFGTPFLEIFRASRPVLKTFSLVLLVAMVVVYFIATRKATHLKLEKQVHTYIYFLVSIILFAFMTVMADQTYNSYQNYINQEFVNPATSQIKSGISKIEEDRILSKLRSDYLEGKCEGIDYSTIKNPGLIQFVYITTDIEFTESQPASSEDFLLKGQECTDGENTMLITEEGKWYWVIPSENL